MSSLASQLQNIASADASRLTSRTGAPSSKSYLFPPKTAASHDLDAIFSLAQSGYEELVDLDPDFEEFGDSLFSEHARRTDRTLLNQAENDELDRVLGRCLRRLGRWVGVMAGGKCMEWLVRRFRVHEMNAETVIQVFLPYHQSPNFPRMLSILTIPQTSRYFAPFNPLIKNAQPLPRSYITQAISPSRDKSLRLLIDIAGMVQSALAEGTVHRGLLTFWSATMVELIETERSGQGVGEGLVKVLVEAFVGILEHQKGGADINAAVYPPLILLSRTVRLAEGPFEALLSALITPSSGADPSQRILTVLFMLNERQDWSRGLGKSGCADLCTIPGLPNLLIDAMEKYSFTAAVKVVTGNLLEDLNVAASTLKSLIKYNGLPSDVVDLIADRLLELGADSAASESALNSSKQLLQALADRHPSSVERARLARVAAGQDTPDALLGQVDSAMAFVNAFSADSAARIRSIAPLLNAMGVATTSAGGDVSMQDGELSDKLSAIEKIQLLLTDTEVEVIKALYTEIGSDATTFFGVLSVEKYLDSVQPVFISRQSPSPVRIAHLGFIADHLPAGTAGTEADIFGKLVFPNLLVTASRSSFTNEEFDILSSKGFFKYHDLLQDETISKAFHQAKSSVVKTKEEGVAFNHMMVQAIGTAIARSSSAKSYHSILIAHLSSPSATTRLLANMVLVDLMARLDGSAATQLGVGILASIDKALQSASLRSVEAAEDPISPRYHQAVYAKPDDPQTARRATLSLLASFCNLSTTPVERINWFDESDYRTLTFKLYRHANSDALPPVLARRLLQRLFTVLREEALTFFASVWTAAEVATPLKVAALRHASAFVKSYTLGTDFQMVMPSILVACTASSEAVREAAVALLKVVNRSASNETKNYYALDTFYGPRSGKVQLLKHGDLVRYLQALIPSLDDISVDASRLAAVQTTALSMNHGRGRKETGHRRAVIGSLLSHTVAFQTPSIRIALLRTLAGVHDTSLLRGALPLLSSLLNVQNEERAWLDTLADKEQNEYLRLVVGSLTAQSTSLLVDRDSDAGKIIRSLLGHGQDDLSARLRQLVLDRMASGVLDSLPSEDKVACLGHIVKTLHSLDDAAQASVVKASLKRFNLDVTSLILVIDDLSKPLSDSVAQPKKQKQDGSQSSSKVEQAVFDLTVLVESRDWQTVPGDAQLVAALMSVLSTLLAKRQSVREGVDYLEQEILGAILALVERIQAAEEIQRAHIGVEVIIKVIRASTNPRTSQRALLVASELARLIPDAVLHNIMPIFTFMSASDLQRDDAYSFGVVEKTVSRIVPVMTRSLKDKAESKLDLYNESLTFISIFTDMAGRLPRHRTMPFFKHLTQSLGPSDYLAPVSMLLAERSATKSGRTAGLTLDLPLGIIATFDVETRLAVIDEIVQELARLLPDLTNPEKCAFLSRLLSEQGDTDRTLRQISVLLRLTSSIIAQLVGRPCEQKRVDRIVHQLILLSSEARDAPLHDTETGGLVYSAVGAAMQLLSAENFLSIIARLLESKGTQDIKVALEVFVDRLPLIKTTVRTKSAVTMGTIVDRTASLLAVRPSLVDDALAALRAVASTALSSEDPALSKAVPGVVEVVKTGSSSSTTVSAMSLLELTARHLSSRIIPHAQPLVSVLLKAAQTASSTSSQSFATLSAVIEAIPTFVSSKQLIAVLRASIDQRTANEGSHKLVITVAKKVPTKALFPVVMELWKEMQDADPSAMEGFFHLLRLTLRNADRQNLPSMIKSIFAFFLDVFDLRHRLQKRDVDQDVVNSIEESAIGSFLELVVKLNEVTFKPLFVRLYDWAVIDLSEGASLDDARLVERKIVLLHVMMGLLQKFKHLLSPYIGILLPHIEELLPAYAQDEIKDEDLWTLLFEVLAKSYEVDDGAFWTDQHHLKLIPLLSAQLPLFPNAATAPLAAALSHLAGSTTSTPVLKSLNTALCLATRSDAPNVRLSALACLDAIWDKQADEMIQFVPETVSEFLSELLEDDNSDVERSARKLLARIEGLTGSLKEYLQ